MAVMGPGKVVRVRLARGSVKLVHGGVDAFALKAIDGLDGAVDGLGEDGPLGGKEFAEDVLDHRLAIGGADADAEARDIPHVVEDGLHAVVAAGGAAGTDADAAERQGGVVEDGEDLGRGDFVKARDGGDGLAAQVHEARRLAENHAAGGGDCGVPFRLEAKWNRGALGEPVHDHKAGIVARLLVFPARITEAGNEAKVRFIDQL